jgi:histidinol phosphatase-like PHP family hydrolase
MIKHRRFEDAIASGRYWFHLHTTATDGSLTPRDYAALASGADARCLIFLEHVRRAPTYDTQKFLDTLHEEISGGIELLTGFEAKLLPTGELDISEADLARADVVGIAEHGWKGSSGLLETTLQGCIARYRGIGCPLVWVHPGQSQPAFRIGQPERAAYLRVLAQVQAEGVWIERNTRYNLVDCDAEKSLPANSLVTGIDCHSAADLKRFQ